MTLPRVLRPTCRVPVPSKGLTLGEPISTPKATERGHTRNVTPYTLCF